MLSTQERREKMKRKRHSVLNMKDSRLSQVSVRGWLAEVVAVAVVGM